MPRKFFKKISPPPQKLAQKSALSWLNGLLHKPDIWSYKRINIAKAFAIGLFCSMLPIPFQMVLAAYIAYLCAANLPISVALVWISNPLTMPALYLFQYKLFLLFTETFHKNISSVSDPDWIRIRMDPYHLARSGSASDDTDTDTIIAPKTNQNVVNKIKIVRKYIKKK